jgi:act minimal PKS ketosynthase (KS/KS alpha)
MAARRPVITGIGMAVPGGIGTKNAWRVLTSGRSAIRRITLFDPTPFRSRIAAECDFVPAEHGLRPQEIRRMDRATQLAAVCTREAMADAGLTTDAIEPERTGVAIGSAVGATMSLEEEYAVVSDGGREWTVDPAYAVPHLFGHFVPSTLAAEVAWIAGAEGPVALISTGCTSGLDSVGYAADLIREGSADVVITGATEAPISPITSACFDAIHATSPNNDHPEIASRPFDGERDGFVLGEGATVLVLEEAGRAAARGAHAYAELVGFASRANAYHMTGLKADGREMAEAIGAALREAGAAPSDVDYINAHGSSTRQNDRHETGAFKRSLGRAAYGIPISSLKSVVGHSLGGIGSIELAACALAIEHNVVPPTANLHTPDPECDLDYVPNVAREQPVDVVLSVGSGFGGFQSAAVLARPGWARR